MSQPALLQLQVSLQNEFSVMSQLADVLKLEQAALVDGNVNDLSEITLAKGRLLSNIAELENARNTQLAGLGFSGDIQGLQSMIEHANDTALSQSWKTLLQISEEAKEINRTNGLLINRHIARNHSALSALQQNDQSLYGPSGQSTLQSSSGRGFVIG